MKPLPALSAAVALGVLAVGAEAAAPPAGVDPLALYGPSIAFDVYRKGARIGSHTVAFRRDGADLVAESNFEIEIRVLGLPLYRYRYTSTERWRDGLLQRIDAAVDDDGDASSLHATRRDGALIVSADGRVTEVAGAVFPTTHWNPGVLGRERVLNTLTGRINHVTLEPMDLERVPAGAGTRDARRFAYRGDLRTEVWYDAAGRWVKMRFDGKDGTPIDYRCRVCGPGDGARADGVRTPTETAGAHGR